ncbi:MAG: hypothetical protein M3328_01565, partial [Chloroflexota bacterium]|nr:hypothetical protein [Chloroflexota bacterium]
MKTEATEGGSNAEGRANVQGAGEDPPELLTRRAFLNKLSIALTAATAAIVGLPVVGFLFAPLLRRPPEVWRPVGAVDHFKVGETVQVKFEDASPLPWAGVVAMSAAW